MKVVFENIQSNILQILDSAKESIEIAVAWFTNAALMDCLINKLSQGIKVTLILNNDSINNNNQNIEYLQKLISNGCKIHWIYYPELMHQKFCIIDNKVVANGSYNWTYYAECHNRENVLIIDEASIAESFHQEFDKMLQLYPVSDIIPEVGGSRYNKSDIDKYKDKDRQFSSNYFNDIPSLKLDTVWKKNSLIHFNVKSDSRFNIILKLAQYDSETILNSSFIDDKYECDYYKTGDLNSTGNQYFKLFAVPNGCRISCRIYDEDKFMGDFFNKSSECPSIATLLYSSYNIDTVVNEHLIYKYNNLCIPVNINIKSEYNDSFDFTIENMLGIKEPVKILKKGLYSEFSYKSVPDFKRYYIVIRTKRNDNLNFHIKYLDKCKEFSVSLEKGITYYIAYLCNLSKRYETKKLFVQQGINK